MAREKITISTWNILDHLKTERDIAEYLDDAVEGGDYAHFLHAIGVAAKARGVNNMAKKLGVTRESLYKNFNGKSRPNFETVFKAIDELGLRIHFSPRRRTSRAST